MVPPGSRPGTSSGAPLLIDGCSPPQQGAAPPECREAAARSSAAPGSAPLAAILERDALFADLQPLVTRLVHQYGEDAEHREDLRGEIFCRFCELLAAYDPARGVPLRPYLVRMLTLAVYTGTRSGWRRQSREVHLESRLVTRQARADGDPSEAWIAQLQADEGLDQLPGVIAQLPQHQRQVVVWRYYELRSFDEIADLLRVRPATVRSLLRHALRVLRLRLVQPERAAG